MSRNGLGDKLGAIDLSMWAVSEPLLEPVKLSAFILVKVGMITKFLPFCLPS